MSTPGFTSFSQSAIGPWVEAPTPCGALSSRRIVFAPDASDLYGRIYYPEMRLIPPRVPLVPRDNQRPANRAGDFHTVQFVVDWGGHRVRPQFVGIVDA